MKHDWENFKKVNYNKNPILNKIGNLFELLARPLMFLYYRWGTSWSIEEINFEEYIDDDLGKQ
jgi:hypothetical protein